MTFRACYVWVNQATTRQPDPRRGRTTATRRRTSRRLERRRAGGRSGRRGSPQRASARRALGLGPENPLRILGGGAEARLYRRQRHVEDRAIQEGHARTGRGSRYHLKCRCEIAVHGGFFLTILAASALPLENLCKFAVTIVTFATLPVPTQLGVTTRLDSSGRI